MQKRLLFGTFGLGLMATAMSANATVIWEDQFERADSNDVGNSWIETESDTKKVKVKNGQLWLTDRSADSSATQNGIDLAGFADIKVVFTWSPKSTESDDTFFVDVQIPGESWSTIFYTGLGGVESFATTTIDLGDLGLAADNVTGFGLRFGALQFDGKGEAVMITSVQITGEVIGSIQATTLAPPVSTTISIAEPASVALFGLGLAGLGFVWRRKSAYAADRRI